MYRTLFGALCIKGSKAKIYSSVDWKILRFERFAIGMSNKTIQFWLTFGWEKEIFMVRPWFQDAAKDLKGRKVHIPGYIFNQTASVCTQVYKSITRFNQSELMYLVNHAYHKLNKKKKV